jgi:hypothetical protein
MFVMYSSMIALSAGPSVRRILLVSSATESSRLCFRRMFAMRLRVDPLSPNMRSNVARGLTATGSGLLSSRQEMALKNTHG